MALGSFAVLTTNEKAGLITRDSDPGSLPRSCCRSSRVVVFTGLRVSAYSGTLAATFTRRMTSGPRRTDRTRHQHHSTARAGGSTTIAESIRALCI